MAARHRTACPADVPLLRSAAAQARRASVVEAESSVLAAVPAFRRRARSSDRTAGRTPTAAATSSTADRAAPQVRSVVEPERRTSARFLRARRRLHVIRDSIVDRKLTAVAAPSPAELARTRVRPPASAVAAANRTSVAAERSADLVDARPRRARRSARTADRSPTVAATSSTAGRATSLVSSVAAVERRASVERPRARRRPAKRSA